MSIEVHIHGADAHEVRSQMAALMGDAPMFFTGIKASLGEAPVAAETATGSGEATGAAAAETVKKTRAKAAPKADAKIEIVAESGVTTDEIPLVETEAKTDEPPAIMIDEVRNSIIDLLNDWSEAKLNDPDIRVATLGPILKKLDADKIKNIDPSKFHLVPALLDESRAELAAFKNAEE